MSLVRLSKLVVLLFMLSTVLACLAQTITRHLTRITLLKSQWLVAFYSCAFTLKNKRRLHLSRASGNLSNLLRGGAEERRSSCLLSDWNTWQLVEVKQTTCHSNGGGGSAAEHGIMGCVVLWRTSVSHALFRDLCRQSLLDLKWGGLTGCSGGMWPAIRSKILKLPSYLFIRRHLVKVHFCLCADDLSSCPFM